MAGRLTAAAMLYIGQFVVGKVPVLDSVWDIVHTALRPVVGAAIVTAVILAAGIALLVLLASRIRRAWRRRREARQRRRFARAGLVRDPALHR